MEPFFVDYLDRLHDLNGDFVATFEDLPAEALDWVPGDKMNSLCVQVVHTTAAARFWIGDAAMGDTFWTRSDEFKAHGLSCEQLKACFETLETDVRGVLERLTLADLAVERTLTNTNGQELYFTAGWALLHALEHTALHLGHAEITRQLWQQR